MRGGIAIRWLARLSGTGILKGPCGLQTELLDLCVCASTLLSSPPLAVGSQLPALNSCPPPCHALPQRSGGAGARMQVVQLQLALLNRLCLAGPTPMDGPQKLLLAQVRSGLRGCRRVGGRINCSLKSIRGRRGAQQLAGQLLKQHSHKASGSQGGCVPTISPIDSTPSVHPLRRRW